ncbi:MAG: hypothetical protein DYG94_05580 [Leptolyngbya sp. PLA3]|nr:hypothetical protein [Leptolyngbya sp. PL-A3]
MLQASIVLLEAFNSLLQASIVLSKASCSVWKAAFAPSKPTDIGPQVVDFRTQTFRLVRRACASGRAAAGSGTARPPTLQRTPRRAEEDGRTVTPRDRPLLCVFGAARSRSVCAAALLCLPVRRIPAGTV